jgi:hypothetical protein
MGLSVGGVKVFYFIIDGIMEITLCIMEILREILLIIILFSQCITQYIIL